MPPDLPDLDPDQDIVAENLRVVQALYFAWQLEEMRAFQVVERVAERFAQGLLPIGRSDAGRRLEAYVFSDDRLGPADRRALYARVLGVPAGSADVPQPDRDFQALWLRFIAAVSRFAAAHDDPPRGERHAAALATAWQAAQALARDASTHGAGLADRVAWLATDANRLRDILRAPDILRAFGARDMWQLIEQVSGNDLGGAANVHRHRSMALSGSAILDWLARHASFLRAPPPRRAARMLAARTLVDAADRWAAAAGPEGT